MLRVNCIIRVSLTLLWLVGAASSSHLFDTQAAESPVVVRGPYLQSGTPSNVVVRWRTSLPSDSRVRYGPATNDLPFTVSDPELKTEHELRLDGLNPNSRYNYAIGTTLLDLAGDDTFFFVTAPAAGAAKTFRVWALGDSGTATADAAAVAQAYYDLAGTNYTEVWLMLGDNAYYSGTDQEYQAAVFEMYPRMLRQSVLWPTLGNHDAYSLNPSGRFPYLDILTLPTQGEAGGIPSGTELYYSFDYANVHFICLDSQSSSRKPGDAMLNWLEEDLNATSKDWIIAFWHHPPYSKGSHNSDWENELVEMRTHVVPVLEAHGVDLVLAGHSHSYERSYLLDGHYGQSDTFDPTNKVSTASGNPATEGPYLKPSGGIGARQGAVYVVAGSSGWTSGGTLNHPAMLISLNQLGSLVLDFSDLRLDARFLRENGEVADTFAILKGAAPDNLRPGLRIARSAGGLQVSWPTTWNSYRLETRSALSAENDWQPDGGTVEQVGRRNMRHWDTAAPAQFFRLRRMD